MKARLLIIIIFLFCILAEGFAFGDSAQIKQAVGPGNAKNTDQLTAIERISNILSLAAIPVVLAVFGWIVQKRLQDQTIKRDYVQLAVSILREQDSATASPELREWAVRLLNENTIVKFGEEVSRKLSSGETSFPSLEKFKGIPTASLTPELDAKYHSILKSFQGYLKRAGFEIESGEVTFSIEQEGMEGFVSLYDPSERTMKILHNYSDDTDLILHEYMHHVLKISDLEPFAKKSWWSYLAVEHGLAVYFTASFNNRAVFGRGKYRSDLNSHLVYSKKPFNENSIHSEGEPLWGGAFWQIRKFLGTVKADKLIAEAWISLQPLKTPERFSEDFMERLILLVSKINDENAEKVKEILTDRGLLSNK